MNKYCFNLLPERIKCNSRPSDGDSSRCGRLRFGGGADWYVQNREVEEDQESTRTQSSSTSSPDSNKENRDPSTSTIVQTVTQILNKRRRVQKALSAPTTPIKRHHTQNGDEPSGRNDHTSGDHSSKIISKEASW